MKDLTPEQIAQLQGLTGNPDTSDIPEAPEENWKEASRFNAKWTNLTFGQAIYLLKSGHKVAREGWNGKNMYLYLLNFDGYEPNICMFTAQGKHQPGWLASQTDMLAEDWCCVESE